MELFKTKFSLNPGTINEKSEWELIITFKTKFSLNPEPIMELFKLNLA